ncbi:FtsK/SpoIIIE domain-containing protein [Terribacillus saccharophilus]|uniref:FtsK/SpoIIIE domain-containing protein n=1 Tax=Terribacillus saccharophilus TaxID=361277 RepID=UPI0039822A4F
MIAEIGAAMLATSVIQAAHYLPMARRRKLNVIFRRNNFVRHVGKSIFLPAYRGKEKTDRFEEYRYTIPLGLTVTEKLASSIEQAFAETTLVTRSEGQLVIRFYRETIPNKVTYSDMAQPCEGYSVPIGMSLDGAVTHDFDKTPHMTVAGATRQGKTVFLKSVITYLTEQYGDSARLYLIDMKGGLEFGKLSPLNNCESVASDVFEAYYLLTALQGQFEADLKRFRRLGYTNIVETTVKERKFIIVDEAAQLAPDKSDGSEIKALKQSCIDILSEVTRVAGALGYRLIYATQYPTADVLPRQIKQNSDAKISFRLPTEIASRVAIDEQGAEKLTQPGRMIYRTHERIEAQAPYISDDEMIQRLKLPKGVIEYERPVREIPQADGGDIITFG